VDSDNDVAYRVMISVDGGPWKIAKSKTCKGIYDKKHFAASAMTALQTTQEHLQRYAKRYDRSYPKKEYKMEELSGMWHDVHDV